MHLKLFGGVNKVAKENLMALPFPKIEADQDARLTLLARVAFDSGNNSDVNHFVNFELFELTQAQVDYMCKALK